MMIALQLRALKILCCSCLSVGMRAKLLLPPSLWCAVLGSTTAGMRVSRLVLMTLFTCYSYLPGEQIAPPMLVQKLND